MKENLFQFCIAIIVLVSCAKNTGESDANNLQGTWRLISGTIIENGDTTVTDYTTDRSMIKIINQTHFSFLNHDLNNGKDSTASFSAGGGRYNLNGETYKEFLEYCSDRQWEGNEFEFTVEIVGDTLVQRGIEKVEQAGVERYNIEKYVRM